MDIARIYINGEPTKYTINRYGDVYSEISHKVLKPFKNPQGYCLIDISHEGKTYTRQLHRLVALAFIPNPLGLETVNHKDGDKSNNAVTNLEWMTRLDNVRHAWRTGLAKPRYGLDNPSNVYTEEQIHNVCALIETNDYTYDQIAEKCNVNKTLVRDIKFRGKWKQISSLYDINHVPLGHKELRPTILKLIDKGLPNREIFEKLKGYGITKRHIEGVRARYRRTLND